MMKPSRASRLELVRLHRAAAVIVVLDNEVVADLHELTHRLELVEADAAVEVRVEDAHHAEHCLQTEADAARELTHHELVELNGASAVVFDGNEALVDAHALLHRDRVQQQDHHDRLISRGIA